MATGQNQVPVDNLKRLQLEREKKAAELEAENKSFSLEKISEMTGYQVDLVKILHKTVAKKTTVPELAYFLSFSRSIGLNPLNKEIWCYKDHQENLIVFTGRDGFLKKGQQSPNWNGMRSCEVCENDEFLINVPDAKIEHSFGPKGRGKIVGAYAIVFVKEGEPTIEWADWETYNKGQSAWKTHGPEMIKKVAECHALKKAFGITGISSEYDFVIKDDVAFASAEVVDTTIDKESDRLMKLIESSKSVLMLEKLLKECNTPDLIAAYDKKKSELTNQNK